MLLVSDYRTLNEDNDDDDNDIEDGEINFIFVYDLIYTFDEGLLTIWIDDEWGTLCNENIETSDLMEEVWARELGYEACEIIEFDGTESGLEILYQNEEGHGCDGDEDLFRDCDAFDDYDWDTDIECNHEEDVGLRCYHDDEDIVDLDDGDWTG